MLTDRQIAILREIGPAASFNQAKKADVMDLVARGYIERDGDLFKLTTRGLKEMLERRQD
jgi:stage V sporulation protein SpoVS